MDYCDNYNDRAITFQILNTEKAVPHSYLGKKYDSNCIDPIARKRASCMQEVDVGEERYGDSIYYGPRSERPPQLSDMINRKHLQFITDHDI